VKASTIALCASVPLAFYFETGATAQAAQFVAERSSKHGSWAAHLFRNLNGNRLFCAIESRNGTTDFRINQYKVSGEAFLELFNPTWTMMEGNVRFTIDFKVGSENYQAEFAGRSWGDSYTHDFTDVTNYHAVLGLIAKADAFSVRNSNGSIIAEFTGSGSSAAIRSYATCLSE
jgi:hypothetical protein